MLFVSHKLEKSKNLFKTKSIKIEFICANMPFTPFWLRSMSRV